MVLLEPREKSRRPTPPRFDPGTVRLVAQCLNHCATPGPLVSVLYVIRTKSAKNTEKYVLLLCLLISRCPFSTGFHSVYEVQKMSSFDVPL